MNILHVVESLDRGGLERVVVDLAIEQQASGHYVAVCCLFRAGILANELEGRAVAVHTIGKRSGFDLKAITRMRALIRQSGVCIVHSHNAVANYYSALARPFVGRVRLINTRHGMGESGANNRKERLYRLSLSRTSAVAAVCKNSARHFAAQKLVPKRLLNVVHNGIRIEKFLETGLRSRRSSRSNLGIAEDALVIGTVGRLNWAKDHAMLIESFARLERSDADRLVIVGDGELRNELELLIQSLGLEQQVILLGDRSDIPQVLAAFDIFALTSETEGYSVALLEAAAAGLAIIASDVGGNSEIVRHNETGILVSPRTVGEFVTALNLLATDSNVRQGLGRGAAKWAREFAGLGSMVSAYNALYSERGGPVTSTGESF